MMKLLVRNRFNFGWDQDLQNWAESDSNDPGYQLFAVGDDEVITQVLGSEPRSSEEEVDEQEEVFKLPSSAQLADMSHVV